MCSASPGALMRFKVQSTLLRWRVEARGALEGEPLDIAKSIFRLNPPPFEPNPGDRGSSWSISLPELARTNLASFLDLVRSSRHEARKPTVGAESDCILDPCGR